MTINIRTNLDAQGRVAWPISPKEGDQFFYLDPISGCDYHNFEYRNGAWHSI